MLVRFVKKLINLETNLVDTWRTKHLDIWKPGSYKEKMELANQRVETGHNKDFLEEPSISMAPKVYSLS